MLGLIRPKLVYLDLPLFMALLGDLFPGVEAPPDAGGALRAAVEAELREAGLQVGLGEGSRAGARAGLPQGV
jgi:dynein heavy chain, axonemal